MSRDVCSVETWVDKSAWPTGPWTVEPDRVEWTFDGVACLALRQPHLGHWCGYAAVPPGHPWHGKGAFCYAEDCDGWLSENCTHTVEANVHGGLTFAEPCADDNRPKREQVCHVPRPGEPDNVWWLGFDCAHAGDYTPRHDPLWMKQYEYQYRTVDYVMTEVESLARQIVGAVS